MEEDRLKIAKVTISGMHKVARKSYELKDGVTYFVGENGAGKSTILEAIQLALLGYIPGYAKTNESIMKHACGPAMSVELELEDNIKITRTWVRSGSSVKASVDVQGYAGELKDLLGEVDLPVFDFNEFRSMTANKLKDWFITFLPASEDELDIRAKLEESIAERALPADELLDDAENFCKTSGLQGVELVRALNAKIKEDTSYVKGRVANLQGTIQSLVRYDEAVDLDEDEIKAEVANLNQLKTSLIQYQSQSAVRDKVLSELDALRKALPAESFEKDERAIELKAKAEEISKKNEVLKADYQDLQMQIQDLERQKAMLPKAGATCPYTNEVCETAANLAKSSEEQAAELDKQIQFKKEEQLDCGPAKQSENDRELLKLTAEIGGIQSQYDKLISMELQAENAVVSECPTELTLQEIDEKLTTLQNLLVQIEANKRYDELSEKVTADKFKLENDLEIYKVWAKLTDANGLQTELMNKPFENLSDEMSQYLTTMFNKEIKAKFNLESKANSFSFGLERDGQYIEFDYLSSGERCLFTLALILCILNKSNSQVKTILIDDILDHLDSVNANYLFDALKGIEEVQFILAGVKECSDTGICVSVQ